MSALKIGRRLRVVLGLALVVLAVPFATPIGLAQACGCGAFSPTKDGRATVPKETGLVRWTGDGYEDIYLSLTLDSDVRAGALLFPVPDRKATVSAGPRDLFATLAALTDPPVRPASGAPHAGNGAAGGRPAVTVENRQQIGPLDVVTLSATDAGALARWLTTHGFAAKPQLADVARTYVDHGWAFVAVRLRPSVATDRLDGQLDPLRLHFRTARPVYPMRLSHLATEPEQVQVYVLSAHRMRLDTADAGMRPVYADRLSGVRGPAVAPLLTHGTTFLTRYDGTLTPAAISDDFRFAVTADDRLRPSPIREQLGSDSVGEPHLSAFDRHPELIVLAALGGFLALGLVSGPAALVHGRRRPNPH